MEKRTHDRWHSFFFVPPCPPLNRTYLSFKGEVIPGKKVLSAKGNQQAQFSHSHSQHFLTTGTRVMELQCDSMKNIFLWSTELLWSGLSASLTCHLICRWRHQKSRWSLSLFDSVKHWGPQLCFSRSHVTVRPRWNFLRNACPVDHLEGYKGPLGSCLGREVAAVPWECQACPGGGTAL